MRVIGNRVLIKRMEDKKLTSSIIEIVQGSGEREEPGVYALVVGVGPGRRTEGGRLIPIECVENDLVIVKKYAGAPMTLRNAAGMQEDFHIVDADDVLAVVERHGATQ